MAKTNMMMMMIVLMILRERKADDRVLIVSLHRSPKSAQDVW